MKNGIVIVNYNDYKTTKRLIDNIRDYKVFDKIVIVDNKSSDNSLKELKKLEFEEIRGAKGIKKATVQIGDKEVKVAVAHGLSNARKIMEEIKNGTSDYQFVEVMACPGGCIMGGGQPIKSSKVRMTVDVAAKRAEAMYSIDERSVIRKSHENPILKQIYKEYIGKPGEHKAHELLHTHYMKREMNFEDIS